MDKLGRGRGLGTEENVFPVTWPPRTHTHNKRTQLANAFATEIVALALGPDAANSYAVCSTHTHTYKHTRALTT